MAGETDANAEVESRIHLGQPRIEAADLVEDRAAHQHARGLDGQDVGAAIVLRLIELILDERDGGTPRGHRLAERAQHAGVVGVDELGPGDRD